MTDRCKLAVLASCTRPTAHPGACYNSTEGYGPTPENPEWDRIKTMDVSELARKMVEKAESEKHLYQEKK